MPDPYIRDQALSEWEQVIAAILTSPGVVLVIGAPDSGKSTWVATAARQLSRTGPLPLAIVNTDIGQAALGPPATVTLSLIRARLPEEVTLGALPHDLLSFVGSVSPSGHLLQLLVSSKRLVDRAKQMGAKIVLVDTTGLVAQGIGFQLKLRKIELLEPAHIVALQRAGELEPLLTVVNGRKGLHIHRLAVSSSVKRRTISERSAYRGMRFAAYFQGAQRLALDSRRLLILAPPRRRPGIIPEGLPDLLDSQLLKAEIPSGLLVGLNSVTDETLALGLLDEVKGHEAEITVRTPLTEPSAVRILQLGSIRLNQPGTDSFISLHSP